MTTNTYLKTLTESACETIAEAAQTLVPRIRPGQDEKVLIAIFHAVRAIRNDVSEAPVMAGEALRDARRALADAQDALAKG